MTESTIQLLDIVACTPGPSGVGKTGKDWALYYLEVQDVAGNPLDGRYKCWNKPLPIGTAEYHVDVEESLQYGRSHTLRPARGQEDSAPRQEPLPPAVVEIDPDETTPDVAPLENVIAALVRRIDKLDERVTVLARLFEAKAVPVGAAKEDDDDIPF